MIAKIAAVLKRQKLAIRIILLLLGIAGFFTALFFLAAFLSPPATAFGILEREKIDLLHFIPEFFLILFSQFTLVRYIHSLESRRMTLKVSDAITRSLQNDVISVLQKVQSGIIDEKEMDCVHLRTMMTISPGGKDVHNQSFPIFSGFFPSTCSDRISPSSRTLKH